MKGSTHNVVDCKEAHETDGQLCLRHCQVLHLGKTRFGTSHSPRADEVQSAAYGQCIVANVKDVTKGVCEKEFMAFKECVTQHAGRKW